MGAPAALFVDDEPKVLAGIGQALRRRSFRLLTASCARSGLELLTREPVAVVVSDEQMPGTSGTEFLTRVRRDYPHIIRIVLSGNMDPQAIARAVNEAGVFRYLLKPCSADDLGLAVDQAIEAGATQRLAPPPRPLPFTVDVGMTGMRIVMQPIFRSAGDEPVAHEALLRLPASSGGTVVDLLEAAAGEGRLWDLERMIRRLIAERMPSRPPGTSVFVNLHPHSLLDPQLYTRVDPLARHASGVVLEITERTSLDAIHDLAQRVARLRGLGYRVAVDDMGSGYSGLTAVATILPDYVKFDRELIRGIPWSQPKQKLVNSMVSVCSELGIATIAEGIEDERERHTVAAMGCTLVQGYLMGRPAEAFYRRPKT